MRISCVDSEKFSHSFDYLQQHCPDQQTFRQIVDDISFMTTINSPSTKSRSKILNTISADWRQLMQAAYEGTPHAYPLLGLRLIQLMHFGSRQGWYYDALYKKVNACVASIGLFHSGDTSAIYKSLQLLLRAVYRDCRSSLPHHPKRFEYILDQYCRQHAVVLQTLPTAQTMLIDQVFAARALSAPPPGTPAEEQAAKALQTQIRRWRTSQSTVYPAQISEIFSTHVLRNVSDPIDKIVLEICKRLTEITAHPQDFKGRSIKFTFPQCDSEPDSALSRFFCDLSLSDDGTAVDVLVCNYSLPEPAQGGLKKVHAAHRFSIPLNIDDSGARRNDYVRDVIVNLYIDTEDFSESDEGSSCSSFKELQFPDDDCTNDPTLMHSHDILERIQAFYPDEQLVMPQYFGRFKNSAFINTLQGPFPSFRAEPWLNCDLQKGISKGMPFDFPSKGVPKELIPIPQRIAHFITIANFINQIHAIGICHHDLKICNIALKDTPHGAVPHLIDWDLATGFGASGHSEDYIFWDSLAKKGWATPFTDWYGLAMSIGWGLIPGFGEESARSLKAGKKVDCVREIVATLLKLIPGRLQVISSLRQWDNLFTNSHSLPDSPFIKLMDLIKSYLILNEHLHETDKAHLKSLILETEAARQALSIVEQAFAMDEAVLKAFEDEEMLKVLKEGSLCDKLELFERLIPTIPLAKDFGAQLVEMKWQLQKLGLEL